MRKLTGYFYSTIQTIVALGLMLPLQALVWFSGRIHPRMLLRDVSRGPYYWAVVRKRRARGEPEWQRHDAMLGIPNPDDQDPCAVLVPVQDTTPICQCGQPLLGIDEGEDECVLCWRRRVNQHLEGGTL